MVTKAFLNKDLLFCNVRYLSEFNSVYQSLKYVTPARTNVSQKLHLNIFMSQELVNKVKFRKVCFLVFSHMFSLCKDYFYDVKIIMLQIASE